MLGKNSWKMALNQYLKASKSKIQPKKLINCIA